MAVLWSRYFLVVDGNTPVVRNTTYHSLAAEAFRMVFPRSGRGLVRKEFRLMRIVRSLLVGCVKRCRRAFSGFRWG